MKTRISFSRLLLLCCLVFSTPSVIADEQQDYKNWCKQQESIADSAVMTNALQAANQLRKDYCLQLVLEKAEIKNQILLLMSDLDALLGENSTTASSMLNSQEALFQKTAELDTLSIMTTPSYIISLGDLYRLSEQERQSCESFAKAKSVNATCKLALEEFKRAYDFAQATYAQPFARNTYGELVALGKRWDRFAAESKAQTSLELLINGTMFNRANDDNFFQAPPDWQLVALHPNLVIENVPDALDGQEVKESILMELVGADFWEQDNPWLPTGASIVALNVDRSGTSDWGYGVGLIFDHAYLLGFTHHEDDQNGIFVSFNILKAFEDKREKLRAFKEKISF